MQCLNTLESNLKNKHQTKKTSYVIEKSIQMATLTLSAP